MSILLPTINQAINYHIISSDNIDKEEIMNEISERLKHGSTKISALGSYSHHEKAVLICVVNRHQIVDFQAILKKYDDTFAFSETVNETYGNFKVIK